MNIPPEQAHLEGALADLATAWTAADAAGIHDPRAIGQQIRCALIACSSGPRSKDIPIELLVALVREKVIGWTPQAALRYVGQSLVEKDRSYAVTQLIPLLTTELLPEALAIVAGLTDSEVRSQAVEDLAAYLPPELVPELLALATALQEPCERAKALEALLPHLPAGLVTQTALDAWSAAKLTGNTFTVARYCHRLQPYLPPEARASTLAAALEALAVDPEDDIRARRLGALAAHLPPDLLAHAWKLACGLSDMGWRAVALIALLPYLPEEVRSDAAQQALAAVRRTESPFQLERAVFLLDLLAYLPLDDRPTLLDEALRYAIQGLEPVMWRLVSPYGLYDLVKRLPEPQLDALMGKILAVYRTWPEADFRGRSASRLLPVLLEHMPERFIPEVLQLARTLTYDERDQCEILRALAPRLNADLQMEALTCVAEMQHPRWRGDVLAALAEHLAAQHLATAVELAAALPLLHGDFSPQIEALAALLPRLAPEQQAGLIAGLVAAARTLPITSEWRSPRVDALRRLAPMLPDKARQEVLLEACGALRGVSPGHRSVQYLIALAGDLPPPQRQAALLDALAATRIQGHDHTTSAFLAGLAPHLPADLRRQALRQAAISAFALPYMSVLFNRWAAVPHGLAADMPQDVMAEALAAVLTYPEAPRERSRRADELCALAPYLPAELLPQALAVLRSLPDAHWSGSPRGDALMALAPYLPETLIEQAYVMACALPEGAAEYRAQEGYNPRLRASLALFPHLPGSLQAAVLEDIRRIPEPSWRCYNLSMLTPHFPMDRRAAVGAEALPGLWRLDDLWYALDGLLRLLPFLPPKLAERSLAYAWTIAQKQPARIRHMDPLQSGLFRLAHHLPIRQRDELLRDQMAAICTMDERGGGGYTLSTLGEALPPELPGRLLANVLATAYRLQDETYRVRAISGLTPRVAAQDRAGPLAAAVVAARETASSNLRALFFARLLPAFAAPDQPAILAEALQAVQAGCAAMNQRRYDSKAETARNEALVTLAAAWARWAETDRQAAYGPWPDTLHALASQARARFLTDLRALISVVLALGAPETAGQVAEAMLAVAQ